jgi:hypothetical protein
VQAERSAERRAERIGGRVSDPGVEAGGGRLGEVVSVGPIVPELKVAEAKASPPGA